MYIYITKYETWIIWHIYIGYNVSFTFDQLFQLGAKSDYHEGQACYSLVSWIWVEVTATTINKDKIRCSYCSDRMHIRKRDDGSTSPVLYPATKQMQEIQLVNKFACYFWYTPLVLWHKMDGQLSIPDYSWKLVGYGPTSYCSICHIMVYNIPNFKWMFPNFKWKILISYKMFTISTRKSQFQMVFSQFKRESVNFKWNFVISNEKVSIFSILTIKPQFQRENPYLLWKLCSTSHTIV